MEKKRERPDWGALFLEALAKPGRLADCYAMFHEYSLGNRILAAIQLAARGLPLAPIASFGKWKAIGRSVKRGEKAISLIMPLTISRKPEDDEPASTEMTHEAHRMDFGRGGESSVSLNQDVERHGKQQQGIEGCRQNLIAVVAIGSPAIGRAPGNANGRQCDGERSSIGHLRAADPDIGPTEDAELLSEVSGGIQAYLVRLALLDCFAWSGRGRVRRHQTGDAGGDRRT